MSESHQWPRSKLSPACKQYSRPLHEHQRRVPAILNIAACRRGHRQSGHSLAAQGLREAARDGAARASDGQLDPARFQANAISQSRRDGRHWTADRRREIQRPQRMATPQGSLPTGMSVSLKERDTSITDTATERPQAAKSLLSLGVSAMFHGRCPTPRRHRRWKRKPAGRRGARRCRCRACRQGCAPAPQVGRLDDRHHQRRCLALHAYSAPGCPGWRCPAPTGVRGSDSSGLLAPIDAGFDGGPYQGGRTPGKRAVSGHADRAVFHPDTPRSSTSP